MPIFGALGLGLTILILKALVPVIFSQLQTTILAFLHGAEVSANVASSLAASAGTIQFPSH